MGIAITIQLYGLSVDVSSNDNHPDLLDDMTNRALRAFKEAALIATEAKVPLYDPEFADPDSDE